MSLSRIYNFSVTSNKKSSFGLFISQCSGTCGLEDVLTGIHVSIQAGTHMCMLAYTNPDTLSPKTVAEVCLSWEFSFNVK